MGHDHSDSTPHYDMERVVAVLSYCTLFGWFAAIVLHGKNRSDLARFHLKQSLGLMITAALLSFIPLIGWTLNLGVVIAWFMAVYYALQGLQYTVPLIGEYYQEHLDFIS